MSNKNIMIVVHELFLVVFYLKRERERGDERKRDA